MIGENSFVSVIKDASLFVRFDSFVFETRFTEHFLRIPRVEHKIKRLNSTASTLALMHRDELTIDVSFSN